MSGPVVQVGQSLPRLVFPVTRTTLVRYAGAAGDFNPIHFSEHAAKALGLESVIAHGMLTMGLAVRVATDWAGPGARLVSYGARFTKPVVVPDDGSGVELHVTGVVSAVEGDQATVTLDVTCKGEKVLGAAKVVLAGVVP